MRVFKVKQCAELEPAQIGIEKALKVSRIAANQSQRTRKSHGQSVTEKTERRGCFVWCVYMSRFTRLRTL